MGYANGDLGADPAVAAGLDVVAARAEILATATLKVDGFAGGAGPGISHHGDEYASGVVWTLVRESGVSQQSTEGQPLRTDPHLWSSECRLAARALAILGHIGHDLSHMRAATAPGDLAALTAGGGATHRSVLLWVTAGWPRWSTNYTPGGMSPQACLAGVLGFGGEPPGA